MSQSFIILIISVFPGIFGGAIFKGEIVGKHSIIKCKANWNVVNRLPRIGEFWLVTGQLSEHPKHGFQLHIEKCNLVDFPIRAISPLFYANIQVLKDFI